MTSAAPIARSPVCRPGSFAAALRAGLLCLAGLAVLAAALAVLSAAPAHAKVFLTVDEALELTFPGCEVERRTVFLEEEQLEAARETSGVKVESGLLYPYVATCDGEPGGVAYFDSHRVRTLPETVMVAVDPEDQVIRIEVVVFREPEEYIPRRVWYEQFEKQPLTDELDLKRDIRNVTGATLTARATTEAVRRVLALHEIVDPAGAPSDSGSAESVERESRDTKRSDP